MAPVNIASHLASINAQLYGKVVDLMTLPLNELTLNQVAPLLTQIRRIRKANSEIAKILGDLSEGL